MNSTHQQDTNQLLNEESEKKKMKNHSIFQVDFNFITSGLLAVVYLFFSPFIFVSFSGDSFFFS